jgi:catechol 2,3-dioxygenase-like lactoylglutathione lyase family enzyme
MITLEFLHHVSLPVTDLARSRKFYSEVLGLLEIARPPFTFPGAWFGIGNGHLHLLVHEGATFRNNQPLNSRDIHFAIRVKSYREAKNFLRSKGYHPEAENPLMKLKESPQATAGFPQLYLMDPDCHVIELNAEKLDDE